MSFIKFLFFFGDVCMYVYVVCEEHEERDDNAADDGDAGCLHPVIPGSQMLSVWQL